MLFLPWAMYFVRACEVGGVVGSSVCSIVTSVGQLWSRTLWEPCSAVRWCYGGDTHYTNNIAASAPTHAMVMMVSVVSMMASMVYLVGLASVVIFGAWADEDDYRSAARADCNLVAVIICFVLASDA